MPGRFYKAHWDIVKNDVCETVIQFFQTGEFVRRLNQTLIVLIPKRDNASCFDDFRPISLCNFAYKVISKLLANRIKILLPNLISPSQSGFVPGRWIAENAYDRMEWSFLDKTLETFSFGAKFQSLVAKCLSSVSFSILLNGGPLRQFKPKRGLRQGDPLSPYLFILCSELLSRMLLKSEQDGLLNGFRFARNGTPLSHFMYANDTLIFCEASGENVLEVQRCLNQYCDMSGQRLNVNKSLVFSSNVAADVKLEIKELLGFWDLTRNDKFLGNLILFSRSKTNDFKFLIDKMARRIEGWKTKLLSQAGRSTLIHSVAMSTPIYTMSTFMITRSIFLELDKLIRRFWWIGSVDKNCYLALKNWDSICVPRKWGGLSFKKFEEFNLALVSKLGWKLASRTNSLWCQFFRDKYFKRGHTFWTTHFRNSMSFGAKGILSIRDLIHNEARYLMGNGLSIDIWHSPWVPGLTWDQFEASFNPRVRERGSMVNSLFANEPGDWFVDAVGEWFLPHVCREVLSIPRLVADKKDELIWKASIDDSFSVKNAFLACIRERCGIENDLWKLIWKCKAHERVKYFLWKLAKDILPFGSITQQIFGHGKTCVLCNDGVDSPFTYFFIVYLPNNCGDLREILASVASCNTKTPEGLRCIDLVSSHTSNLLWSEHNFFMDAAVCNNWGSVAVLAWDASGSLIEALTVKSVVSSPFVAKLVAIQQACCRALLSGLASISIFSD
uniref:Reverse transcriptase domain-containing protein n=1 Tax=Cannabis sativa TaxID=3483 RepID=A0A803Q1M2_CANSA